MLSLAEEVLLLALDDERGVVRDEAQLALDQALVCAVLMDLALANRVDTDPGRLWVVDPRPTGDAIADEVLAALPPGPAPQPIEKDVRALLVHAGAIRRACLDRLIARGVLRREERRVLWVFGVRRYPMVDGREETEVRARLRELVLGDALPDPRDAVLVSLVDACRLWPAVLTAEELRGAQARIACLARLDFIGQALARAIRDIETFLLAIPPI